MLKKIGIKVKAKLKEMLLNKACKSPLPSRFARACVFVAKSPEKFSRLRTRYKTLRKMADDQDNLTKSFPVALRKNTQSIDNLRSELSFLLSNYDDLMKSLLTDRHKNLLKSLPVVLRRNARNIDANAQNIDASARSIDVLREQLATIQHQIKYVTGRVEFVRRELMFEMAYGQGANLKEEKQLKTAATKIISHEKLELFKTDQLRLNLGCGHQILETHLNVDRRDLIGIDIIAEVDCLPFEAGEVDEIFSAHLLEHFPEEELRRTLLPYWVSLIKNGGKFRAVVPDAETMIKAYAKGDYPYAHLREVTFGSQDYRGDYHYNMFTAEHLIGLLEESGLSELVVVAQGRKNGLCFEMEVVGVKQ